MSIVTFYLKDKTDELLGNKVTIVTELPTGKTTTDTVTFQDLIDMGIIVLPTPSTP